MDRKLIDAYRFEEELYHEAFERDSDMQRWDSGCWIRYKLFERMLEKQPAVDVEPHWIPCSERLPKEREWIGTKEFGTTISDEVYVTFEGPTGERFCKHLSFQNGKLSPHTQREIDVWYKGSIPIAWMPLPEPYEGKE